MKQTTIVQSATTISKLNEWCNGKWLVKHDENYEIEELAIDTRKIGQVEKALFVALKTTRRDGHSYISEAYEKGVRNFLVTADVNVDRYPAANFIQVKDTLTALQQIAIGKRKQYNIPVVGITGSNGKTIVKEWLYQLLSADTHVVRSPKSYNSQIGVPLSVWLMEDKHKIAVFEAGISQPGEMEKLERMIQPSIGLFTNIGEAHSEGFLNKRQKINEKLMLFRHVEKLVYSKDYPDLNECIAQFAAQQRNNDNAVTLFTWSYRQDADLRITKEDKTGIGSTTISAVYKDKDISITIPFTDPASIENAIHCWCIMLLLGKDEAAIEERMKELQPVSMRLELRHGINDCTFINDAYNSDVTSLLIALEYLEQQKQHKHHTVILSDMLQIGKPDAELYEEVADYVSRRSIQRFIGIGPALYKHKSLFRVHKKMRSIFFKSTEDFLKNFHLITFDNEAILLKGARAFAFEKVSKLLEQKVHQTVLSINLSSLVHNLNVYRSKLQPEVKTMAMVKAFSYGSGSYEIANLLQYSGVDYLSVAYTDEGVGLRKAGITLPVMVMSPDISSFDRMIAWKLEPEIFNLRSLKAFTDMAVMLQVRGYPVHIKLDTGMHRLGFAEDEIDTLLEEVANNPYIHVASIFSHLASSEDPTQDDFTKEQAARFRRMSDKILERLPHKPLRHLCNSAAVARHTDLHFDMVRLGLGLYGIDGSEKLTKELRQIGALKTTIAQIKDISAGESIGYNRAGRAEKPMRIATISIGYADGFPRNVGYGKAHVLIHGKPAKVTGAVCMDMCMVDITNIPEATEGDEVIVFGPELPLKQLAQWADTIPYEIMTGISQRVKRVYENEI